MQFLKIPYLLWVLILQAALYCFMVFAFGDFIDGVSSFSRLKFWIVLLPIWFVLTLYVFVRAIFMLRAKGLNYFATDEELCEAMKRDKLDRNIV